VSCAGCAISLINSIPIVDVDNSSVTIINTLFFFKAQSNVAAINVLGKSALALNNVTFAGNAAQIHVSVGASSQSKVYVSQQEVLVVDNIGNNPWPLRSSFGNARAEDKTLLLEDDPWLLSMRQVRKEALSYSFAFLFTPIPRPSLSELLKSVPCSAQTLFFFITSRLQPEGFGSPRYFENERCVERVRV
jgi:hypothetical protein